MKPRACFILLALCATAAAAQKLAESIEVHVVNVDVVVTDKSGKHVRGLTRDDFQIFENGKPQPITNFYEVGGEAAPDLRVDAAATPATEDVRARKFVIFIDDYSINPHRRNRLIEALQRFTDREVRAGDEATVVAWDRSLRVPLQLTSDKAALHAALEAEKKRAASEGNGAAVRMTKFHCEAALRAVGPRGLTMQQAFDECRQLASSYSELALHFERVLIQSIRITMSTMAGVEGKKVFIFAGSHLPEVPGREMHRWVSEMFPGMNALPEMEGADRSQVLNLNQLAREANADGITFYPFDTADSGLSSLADAHDPTSPTEAFVAFTNTAAAYQTLADLTGGVAITDVNNYDVGLETIATDLSSYYSLGYKPSTDSGGDRKISVRMKNPAYRVRSRRTFAVKSTDEQVSDRVLANIARENIKSEWPMEIRVGKPVKAGRFFNVPFELVIAPNVTLLRDGDDVAGGFTVYVAVGDDQGRLSDVTKRIQPVRIPASAEEGMRKAPITFRATLQMRGGENTISAAVVDTTSNVAGYQRVKIVVR
jgi:VWFA-related protein